VTRQPTPRPIRRPFAALAVVAVLLVVASAVAACSASAEKLTGTTWQLSSVTEKVPAFQGVVPPEDQSRYTITFNEDGTAAIKADCNNVAATYTTEETNIKIVPGPSTLAACPDDSLSDKFVAGLSSATTYNIRPSGLTLYILNEGQLEFVAAK
jgi:heat shock protein HslJ